MDVDRALEYVSFVTERHRIWERRQAGEAGPWTVDPILATKKFTNVFRVLDWDSQWVMKHIILKDPHASDRDMLMRLFLFRHTGQIDAWDWLIAIMGLPQWDELDLALRWWTDYRGESIAMKCGTTTPGGGSREGRRFTKKVFTGAYMVFPQSATPGTDKLEAVIRLTQRLFDPSSPDDVMPAWESAKTAGQRFAALRRNKGVADFMSMQILTDWGYARGGDEEEFVVLGPGARKGIRELYGREHPEDLFRARELLGDSAPTIDVGGTLRAPSLMDLQNTFCEFSKYVRGPRATRYTGRHKPLAPVYPTHWRKQ